MVDQVAVPAGKQHDALPIDPRLLPVDGFDAACELVLDYLAGDAPMGLWAISRITGNDQVMIKTRASSYPVEPGLQLPFDTSFCRLMLLGDAPPIAPDVTVVQPYRAAQHAAATQGFNVGAYVGMPIMQSNGDLFGTVCGFSPQAAHTDTLARLRPLLAVFSTLLSTVLAADTAATAATRESETHRLEADIDALTGLLNRRGWDRFVAHEESRHRRFGDPASVVVLDLDRLKDVNDQHGHAAGDAHIQAAAAALRSVARESDVLARLGGDEFAVLAIGTDAHNTAALVQRMKQALDEAGVAGSFGYAPHTVVAGFPGALAAADQAMYQAKHQRRTEQR